MLPISISYDDLCLHKKIKKNINGRAIFVIVVVERWASFYRIYDRQNVPASGISKIGRFGPGFPWSTCRSVYWKEILRIFDRFVLPLFSARTFLAGEFAILKSVIFWVLIFVFEFLLLELHISFTFVNAEKLTNQISKTAS